MTTKIKLSDPSYVLAYCNERGYSEIYPYEVVRHVSRTIVEVRRMNYLRDPKWKPEISPGGFAGHCSNQSEQTWLYESDPDAPVIRVRWAPAKRQWQYKGTRFVMSHSPRYFHDYNF
jgi:hypothetical protein